MYVVIIILIILVCAVLIASVLIQNPKGGGLSASFGGMGNQVMGARKATDFIEKTTWVLAVSLLVLCLLSGAAIPGKAGRNTDFEQKVKDAQQTQQPAADPNAQPAGPEMPPPSNP